jgi:hypothetical protein
MRTKGKVNTIDGPGKKFRWAFSLTPKRGFGITLTAFSNLFKYITTASHNKVQVKKSKAKFCTRIREFRRRQCRGYNQPGRRGGAATLKPAILGDPPGAGFVPSGQAFKPRNFSHPGGWFMHQTVNHRVHILRSLAAGAPRLP